MPNRGTLSEFQSYLANRLAVSSERGVASLLGVLSGSEYWLLDLSESGEVVALPELTGVPLTQPWFLGLANIRGNLYSVIDFSVFQGQEATPHNASARLLLIGTNHGSNAALLVNRIVGLRNIDDLSPAPQQDYGTPPDWAQQAYTDREGRYWKQLKVEALLADERFMDIGIPS